VVDTRKPEPGRGPDRTEPSQEDIRDYTRRLRPLPVDQVIGEVMFTLLNAAQVKVGRRDARLLIDVVSVWLSHARGYLQPSWPSRWTVCWGSCAWPRSRRRDEPPSCRPALMLQMLPSLALQMPRM
jgi:hypothetical protein